MKYCAEGQRLTIAGKNIVMDHAEWNHYCHPEPTPLCDAVWKVGDRVTLKDGDGSVAVVNSSGPDEVCYSYLDDPEDWCYYCHPDDLVAAPEEKRCCETCGYSRPLVADEGLREIYTDLLCGAPLPLCVNSTSPVSPATSGCPVWRPRV